MTLANRRIRRQVVAAGQAPEDGKPGPAAQEMVHPPAWASRPRVYPNGMLLSLHISSTVPPFLLCNMTIRAYISLVLLTLPFVQGMVC